MNKIPEKCPNCGARDFDVQMICWIQYSDGKPSSVIGDDGKEDLRGAGAYCPTCDHEWTIEWVME